MMLFKLSLKNIRKSVKDYTIYFFTLILGVAIFYVFNAIESQTVMMNVSSSTHEVIGLMNNMLSGVSVFVSFILGFLVIYASRFLIKRRNKEFGIYLTLGMSKRKISMILFIETVFIGVISLGVGLIIGVGLSQLMSLLVANMFEADMTKFEFVFSSKACIKTLLYFGIMYLLVMIFNTANISRCKLIDLLSYSKKSEQVKLKNPILCTIVFVISVAVLGYAYYMVTGGIEQMDNVNMIFIPIAMGIVSTFLIFWSLSGLLLRVFMSAKGLYYRGLNSFIVRQISSKINTTVFSMSIICLMLFVTICVLSSSLSIKNSMTSNLESLTPIDIEISKSWDISTESSGGKEAIAADSLVDAKTTLTNNGFDLTNFKNMLSFNLYSTDSFKLKDTLGDYYNEAKKEYQFINYEEDEYIVKLSDYNKVAKLYGTKEVSLADNQYAIIADFDQMMGVRDIALKNNTSINLLGKTYTPKYQECQDGFIDISANHINAGLFIVPDNAVDESMRHKNILLANYNVKSDEEKHQIEDKISSIFKNNFNVTTLASYNTKIDIYEASIGLGALVTFIGLYLGIIFLISSAAILALKELSESSDNKERFAMLRKIGTDERMINRALFSQIAIFFAFPLILAIIHSVFGIMFCNYFLVTFGNEQLLPSILMTAAFLIVIYGGYFLITYWCSKNIIKDEYVN